jgi:hypothetical protein
VRISPFGLADIFQTTNNFSSKVACVHGPASGQDIQEVLPRSIEKRSDLFLSVIMPRPLKFIHVLPRRCPHCFMMMPIEHSRLIASLQEVEIGGCMTFQCL